jgi:hypothetical protein
MPFYPNLKFTEKDSAAIRVKKQRVIERLQLLKDALHKHVALSEGEAGASKSVRIATWNLREFGKKNYGGRSFEELYYIAEILSKFDLIALQEIRSDLSEFRSLKRILGPQWDYIATDVADGRAGNDERMVFLYNTDIVQFRNIAGELTLEENQKVRASFGERIKLENGIRLDLNEHALSGIYDAKTETKNGKVKLREDLEIPLPQDCSLILAKGTCLTLKKGTEISRPERGKAEVQIPAQIVEGCNFGLRFPEDTFDDSLRQFARTPFLISFRLGWLKLNLCTVHIYYGSNDSVNKLNQRKREIELLTAALAKKARREFREDKESFLGVLGDFNIIGKNHPTMKALESNGFYIPPDLKSIPGTNVARDKAYDQIAFWMPNERSTNYSKLEITGANVFDFYQYIYTAEDEEVYRAEGEKINGLKTATSYASWRTYKMSDHLPMWVALKNDFSEEYLEYLESENQKEISHSC